MLTLRPDVQNRLREEIVVATGNDGDYHGLNYDTLMDLPFLDAVCRETLRLYAPLPFRNRRYARPYSYSLRTGLTLIYESADLSLILSCPLRMGLAFISLRTLRSSSTYTA